MAPYMRSHRAPCSRFPKRCPFTLQRVCQCDFGNPLEVIFSPHINENMDHYITLYYTAMSMTMMTRHWPVLVRWQREQQTVPRSIAPTAQAATRRHATLARHGRPQAGSRGTAPPPAEIYRHQNHPPSPSHCCWRQTRELSWLCWGIARNSHHCQLRHHHHDDRCRCCWVSPLIRLSTIQTIQSSPNKRAKVFLFARIFNNITYKLKHLQFQLTRNENCKQHHVQDASVCPDDFKKY